MLYFRARFVFGHTPRERFEQWLGKRYTLQMIYPKINPFSAKRGIS